MSTADDARKQLQEDGQLITLTRITVADYEPNTGDATLNVPLVYESYGYPANYKAYEIANALVGAVDVKLILAVPLTGEVPQVNDLVTFNNDTLRVMNVKNVTESGVSVLYILQCRQ